MSETLFIPFVKISGAGNDFILIDEDALPAGIGPYGIFAKAACNRHYGTGADGLLVVKVADKADFEMDYYNADGSTGGMCGNGARCVAGYVMDTRKLDRRVTFKAFDHTYTAERKGSEITVEMKNPSGLLTDLELDVGGKKHTCHYIDTGSPHVVVIVDGDNRTFEQSFDDADIEQIGRQLRYHEAFKPFGTNVNFIAGAEIGKNTIRIRTYERGVESETLACGTGSVASAIIAALLRKLEPPVYVHTRSGFRLAVDFRRTGREITSVTLTGPYRYIFTGRLAYNPSSQTTGSDEIIT